jgi:hypothetical protein
MYFSLIRLSPNFYDMYIMYHNKILYIIITIIMFFYNPKFKNLSSGYNYFW